MLTAKSLMSLLPTCSLTVMCPELHQLSVLRCVLIILLILTHNNFISVVDVKRIIITLPFKGSVHPTMKIQSLSTHLPDDAKSSEVL